MRDLEFGVLSARSRDERAQWSALLRELPADRRDVYFTPGYLSAFQTEGDGEPVCAFARAGSALWVYPFLLSAIPARGGIEGRFDIQSAYGYGGPLLSPEGESGAFLEAAWDRFAEWAREKGVVAEFVRFHPLIANQRWAAPGTAVEANRSTVVIDLRTYPQAIWEEPYFRVHRHMVRKAERTGYRFEVLPAADAVDSLAAMYAATQERLKARAETRFGAEHFRCLADELGEQAWVGGAFLESELVGAVLVLESDWYEHSHLMGYRDAERSNGLTNWLYHRIALEGARRGRGALQMGGGTTASADDSLFRFKRSLSPARAEFHVGKLCRDPRDYEALAREWERQEGPRPPDFFLFYRLRDR